MQNIYKSKSGVITVMIALMLAGILSLGTLVIEAGRMQGARNQLDLASQSAATSMLASYNDTLFERFGLLAIDNAEFNNGRFMSYLEFNSDRASGFKGNNISTFYTIKSAELQGMYNLTYPEVLKRQILARAKYNIIPQDYSLNYYNMDYLLLDFQQRADYLSEVLKPAALGTATPGTINDIPADMQGALNNLYSVFSKSKKYDDAYNVTIKTSDMVRLPSVSQTVKHDISNEDLSVINNTIKDAYTVLGSNGSLLTSNNGKGYSEIDVTVDTRFAANALQQLAPLSSLPSNAVSIASDCRTMVSGISAAFKMLSQDKQGNLLLNSYIAGYFPNKNYALDNYAGFEKGKAVSGKANSNFAGACAEYVFSGDKSEIINQQNAYTYVIAVRFINNLYSTITNSKHFNQNNACSVAAHIAWAYYESCADAEMLFKYNATVPFNKYNMVLPITNPSAVRGAFASGDFQAAMRSLGILKGTVYTVEGQDATNYRDALAFALWIVPNSKKMLRVADLVQLEMRYREQYIQNTEAQFLMSNQNTFCRVKTVGKLNSILPVLSLGSNNSMANAGIQSIKYVGY